LSESQQREAPEREAPAPAGHNKPPKRVLKPRPTVNTEAQVAKAEPDDSKAQWYKVKGNAGLYLIVDPPGKKNPKGLKRWTHRYRRPADGEPTEMGIGHWPEVKLEQARAAWMEHRHQLKIRNTDPQEVRRVSRGQRITFGECADEWFKRNSTDRSESWKRNIKILLYKHCAKLTREAVGTVIPKQVEEALLPLVDTAPTQVRRACDLLTEVFDFARSQGWRIFENPARWELQKNNFPTVRRLKRKNLAALHYSKVPDFMRRLRQHQGRGVGAVALEAFILMVPRPNVEFRLIQWSEIDWDNKVLNIPAERMKTRVAFRVPLVDRVIELLRRRQEQSNGSPYVFTGYSKDPLAERAMLKLLRDTLGYSKDEATIHAFRSSFRDWVGAETNFDQLAAELCISHKPGNKAVQAYLRDDLLDKRREIMQAWSEYCGS
jgi:integrase